MAALCLDPETKVEEEYNIVHFQFKNQSDLSIAKIPTGNIYKQTLLSPFNIRKDYKIITMKKTLSIKESKNIYLLSRDDIRTYRSKYQFLHIGLVQFSMVEPQSFRIRSLMVSNLKHRLSLSVRLRDSKYSNLEDSILVSFQTTVREVDGAIKFNWFPNYSTSLFDLANSNGLVVTIDLSGYSVHVDVKYRVCYKLMKKTLKPDYLFGNPVVEVNTEITNFVVPKII